MKNFDLRNDTLLLFRDDPCEDLMRLCDGRRVLFVYGGGSVKRNGCLEDVEHSVEKAGGQLFKLAGASRELADIERGIALVKEQNIELVIGAGGASVMDCAKLVAFGALHADDLWEFVKGRKSPRDEELLPLVLMPTYPSSGSEYGLGAVAVDSRTGDFGTAYGIPAKVALLTPRYSMSLDAQMTAYAGLVTVTQLCASVLGDKNRVSYDMGITVIRNVIDAAKRLVTAPNDENARGTILYGAALSTSSRLGLGKESDFAYDIYELEFIPEKLFGVPYRQSLTTLFPRFLGAMGERHEAEVTALLADAFGLTGIEDPVQTLVSLYEEIGVDMYFDGAPAPEMIDAVPVSSELSREEIRRITLSCCRA